MELQDEDMGGMPAIRPVDVQLNGMDNVDNLFGPELASNLAMPMAYKFRPQLHRRMEDLRNRGCRQ